MSLIVYSLYNNSNTSEIKVTIQTQGDWQKTEEGRRALIDCMANIDDAVESKKFPEFEDKNEGEKFVLTCPYRGGRKEAVIMTKTITDYLTTKNRIPQAAQPIIYK